MMRSRSTIGLMIGLTFALCLPVARAQDPACFTECTPKLLAGGGDGGDIFGNGVAIFQTTAVVSAYEDEAGGSAYVFEPFGAGCTWNEIKRLRARTPVQGDTFGIGVKPGTIHGDTIVIGAPGNGGAVYVYERNEGSLDNWGERAKLEPCESPVHFGQSAAIEAGTAIIGDSDATAAYVFERGGGWVDGCNNQTKRITAPDGVVGVRFGHSAAICGDTVFVGDYYQNSRSGAVYVYQRDVGGVDNWGFVMELIGSGVATAEFGSPIDCFGDCVVVGASLDDPPEDGSGAAYVFCRNVGGVNNWGLMQQLLPADGDTDDFFGTKVSIHDSTMLIGASNDEDCPGGAGAGSAYVFRLVGGTWQEVQKLCASDGASADAFGQVDVFGPIVLIGAPADDDLGPRSGSAYVFHELSRCDDVDCDDGNVCTDDFCDADFGCIHLNNTDPCPDGLFCNGTNTCGGGSCVSSGDPCPGPDGDGDCAESCNEAAELCNAPDPLGSVCDDGTFCTAIDECNGAGACIGTVDPCLSGMECADQCNEQANNCNDPIGTPCTDDGEICTNDQCDGAGTCDHPPVVDGTPCPDDLFCNGDEKCQGGVCQPGSDPCDGGPECDNECNEATEDCFNPSGTACGSPVDDECTDPDTCNGDGACRDNHEQSGTPCGDPTDDDCTNPDTCDGAGTCQDNHEPPDTPCNDGRWCTVTDESDGAGACMGRGDPCAASGVRGSV